MTALLPSSSCSLDRAHGQRGAALLFTLIALVAMTIAALALVRSVDTATLIAGNLAFRQSTTASGDGGVEDAVAALNLIRETNIAKNVYMDDTHGFNVTNADAGYYSNLDLALDVRADSTWVDGVSSPEAADSTGNRYRYVIQRMCRDADQVITRQNCLFAEGEADKDGMAVPLPSEICEGSGCPTAGQAPQYRITVRVTGPKNTVSYIQALVH